MAWLRDGDYAAYVFAIGSLGAYIKWDVARYASDQYAIRLASRSGLSGGSVDGVGLLFLPAAGWITKDPWKINGGWARYWAVTGGSDYAGNKRGFSVDFQGAKVFLDGLMARFIGFSIRLASRSELFGCSFDGFGLLFLPADCWAVWSVSSVPAEGNVIGDAYRVKVAKPFGAAKSYPRTAGHAVRLASREDCLL